MSGIDLTLRFLFLALRFALTNIDLFQRHLAAFILIYVIYLIVALSGQAVHSRLQGNYAIAERQIESQFEEEKSKNE